MRGNLLVEGESTAVARSIPAYAGEPGPDDGHPASRTVYPRVCGGTRLTVWVPGMSPGLSPRMRGNQSLAVRIQRYQGSIPAYAGEPELCGLKRVAPSVYPRVCGETPPWAGNPMHPVRLSPRMRGNRRIFPGYHHPYRSIPAYAGEPMAPSACWWRIQVYPRVCGGTNALPGGAHTAVGLSPRMRGNPAPARWQVTTLGSIPAYAGEPWQAAFAPREKRVYPRVCGGTRIRHRHCRHTYGLSPRMRGNHRVSGHYASDRRSIPAYAGEPQPVPVPGAP